MFLGIRTVSFDPLLPCNSHHIPLVARVGRPRATQARPTTTRAPEIARVLPIPTTSISISLGNGGKQLLVLLNRLCKVSVSL